MNITVNNQRTHCFYVTDVTFMKTDCELGHKAIFNLKHYPEELFETENVRLYNSWVKENYLNLKSF